MSVSRLLIDVFINRDMVWLSQIEGILAHLKYDPTLSTLQLLSTHTCDWYKHGIILKMNTSAFQRYATL
jgi:hypothetical protein